MRGRRTRALATFGTLLAAGVAGALLVGRRSAERGSPPFVRPHSIVVIVIDTLRADHLPVYGYGKNTAPFLSSLATSSAVFEQAYSTSAWTAPATASLFTSLHPFQHGVVTGFFATRRVQETGVPMELNRLPEEVETMPEVLARAGYAALGLAANINIGREMGFTRGFQKFKHYPGGDHAGLVSEKVRDWKERMRARPSFLYIHFIDPHAPYRQIDPWYEPAADPTLNRMAAYDSEIRFTDERIRELYVELDWANDAFLVITSDHGEEFGDHGGRGHGQTLYREMLHVPLIVRPPGGMAALRVRGSGSLLDVLPTLREVAGLPPGPSDQGVSLVPVLRGAELPRDRLLLAHLERQDQDGRVARSISDGAWKAIDTTPGDSKLFHLPSDPGEQRNRLQERPRLAATMRAEYRRIEASSRRFEGATLARPLDAETLERLKALGYAQ